MRPRLNTLLILSVLLTMLACGDLAFADNAASMAKMQKTLNAEILAEPFRVAAPTERPVAAEPTQKQNPVPRCSHGCGRSIVYPYLSLGWHYGHRSHRFGGHYGHHSHRYGLHRDRHFRRYRRY